MNSKIRSVSVEIDENEDVESATLKFLDMLCEAECNDEETCSADEEPPVLHCVRLDTITAKDMAYAAEEIFDPYTFRMFEKRTVRRRLNFNHPDDEERLVKKKRLRRMMLLHRTRHSRKRNREDDATPTSNTKRMKF